MRDTGPVTGNEYVLPDHQYLVSCTDTRGVIKMANDGFVAASGFTRQELLGQSHNIVRHPDMPPAAFADLWANLKAGRSWVGFVKNRRKNGDHYWVRAAVSPVTIDGQVTGYISVRTKPARADVAAAEAAYARIRAGDTSIAVGRGQVVRTGIAGWLARTTASFKVRLGLGFALILALVIAASAVGLKGMLDSNQGLQTMYADRLVCSGQINDIGHHARDARDAVRGLAAGEAKAKTGMEDCRKAIADNLKAYLATYLTTEEQVLATKLEQLVKAIDAQCFQAALALAQAGKQAEIPALVQAQWQQLDTLDELCDQLISLQQQVGKQILDEQQEDFAFHFWSTLALSVMALIAAMAVSLIITRRLGGAVDNLNRGMDRIAGGRFDDPVDLSRNDEFAPLMLALASLQTKLGYISISEREARAELMREFDASVGQVLHSLTGSIENLRGTAQGQSGVSAQVASNAQTVASSASELNASIKEIAGQATQVSELARATAEQAKSSRETMARLAKAGQEITAVAKLIAEIAEQTNLLALNATIEAARAGDVGRGFAVVAGEVKSLANQTQSATGDISRKIQTVQSDTQAAVDALESMAKAIDKLNDSAHTIAAAVEEQSAVVDEVAKNAEQTAAAAGETGQAAKSVAESSESLAQGNVALAQAVGKFKSGNG